MEDDGAGVTVMTAQGERLRVRHVVLAVPSWDAARCMP
ncbi:hypothetical protein GFS60_02530 [Rhodococcus sp. WAY2]|nr:hypothetical protein GFS60_02530 [Rhodococcus sp. WAY2]